MPLDLINDELKKQNTSYDKKLVREAIIYLDDLGWSELIDPRWENEVTDILTVKFPNITEKEIEKIFETILL
jgi:hypothetical protein